MKTDPFVSEAPRQGELRRKATWRFLGVFLGTVAVYYSLTLSPWIDANVLYPVLKASAQGTSALLNLGGVKTTVEGVIIRGPTYSVAVRRGCDPLEPIVLFAAGVIGFPAPWRRRLSGVFAAGALLFGLNMVRIASLYVMGAKRSPMLDSFHLWYWPAFFILCSLALWVCWIRWIQRPIPASISTAKPPAEDT